ncbi:MAG TPA: hypothetical protein VHF26_23855 [Trebonia sp.]|nr:hypothetical protein [Trebonia sp.]
MITDEQAAAWIAKGAACAESVLRLAGDAAMPRRVVAQRAAGTPRFGDFMICWPEHRADAEAICHIADAGFFLRLLRKAYEPALRRAPGLGRVITPSSRCEVAFTNDVLQVQLREVTSGYSMIRHHSLMLFYGTLWLDEPARTQWFTLYAEVARAVTETTPLPARHQLDAIERRAFDDFARLAERSVRSPGSLLDDEALLGPVLDYLRFAAVAIAAVEYDHRQAHPENLDSWHSSQLQQGYQSEDYPLAQLERLWRASDRRR